MTNHIRGLAALIITAGMLFSTAACGLDTPEVSSAVPAPTPSAAPTSAAPSPTPTTEETVETTSGDCASDGSMFSAGSLNIMADSWGSVIAAHGASDEADMVESFAGHAKSFYDDLKDVDSCTDEAVLASEIAFQANLILLPVMNDLPANEEAYETIVKDGNDLLQAWGESDNQFIPLDCTGSVDDTDECTALMLG